MKTEIFVEPNFFLVRNSFESAIGDCPGTGTSPFWGPARGRSKDKEPSAGGASRASHAANQTREAPYGIHVAVNTGLAALILPVAQ